jgi:acyl carrier protein
MREAEARVLIFDVLGGIAPETDPATVGDDDDLREALDLDSMDFMNFVVALHERTGVGIPEADYPELHTLDCHRPSRAKRAGLNLTWINSLR